MIYAPGYQLHFLFLEPQMLDVSRQPLNLYRHMVHTEHPNLHFAGLVQPVGPTIALVEIQARWLASVLSGELVSPELSSQKVEIERYAARKRKTYLDLARYQLEVDFASYARDLRADLKRQRGGS